MALGVFERLDQGGGERRLDVFGFQAPPQRVRPHSLREGDRLLSIAARAAQGAGHAAERIIHQVGYGFGISSKPTRCPAPSYGWHQPRLSVNTQNASRSRVLRSAMTLTCTLSHPSSNKALAR